MEFLEYLKYSVSPHHVTHVSAEMLKDAGFTELWLDRPFDVVPGGKYFVNIFSTAFAAFIIGKNASEGSAFHVAAAHTDHPCFHIKPTAEIDPKSSCGWMKLNCEPYSSSIFSTWLDRPLNIAGLVSLKNSDPFAPELRLFDFGRPVAIIPNLAIHFNREVNNGVKMNPQVDLIPALGMVNDAINKDGYLVNAVAKELNVDPSDILDMDLYVTCADKPQTIGLNNDMISAPALDNLTSCYAILNGLKDNTPDSYIDVALLFDHEEIGSHTKTGADSAVFKTVLEKIWLGLGFSGSTLNDAILKSFLFSVDVGHATHPNHPEKCDATNKINFGEGVTLKVSSNQKYTLDASALATAEMLCNAAGAKYRKMMFRADIPGGSTIGPMLSSLVPMHTADIGVPILAMHSACELMQASDEEDLVKLMRKFYE